MEEFRDIKGYEGLYQVSNLGNVKSLRYNKSNRAAILKPRATKTGYQRVGLHLKGATKDYYIHRLVADAFLDNPNNLTDINHKDEDKSNNHVDNLEWVSHKDNMNYGTIKVRIAATLRGRREMELNAKQKALAELMVAKPELTNVQLAEEIDIDPKTLYKWKKTVEFQDYLHSCYQEKFKEMERLAIEKLRENIANNNQKAIEYTLDYLGYKATTKIDADLTTDITVNIE